MTLRLLVFAFRIFGGVRNLYLQHSSAYSFLVGATLKVKVASLPETSMTHYQSILHHILEYFVIVNNALITSDYTN
jgi:hypothetical protein